MAGGQANLWDFYIIQTLFVFVCPIAEYMFPLMIEYWLLGLPSQVSLSESSLCRNSLIQLHG